MILGKMLLTIQNGNKVFSPPVIDDVQIEWERVGSPGKLTFTTIKIDNDGIGYNEGDPVCFYYDDKKVFMGYIFKKTRDKDQHIKIVAYDQLRYLKNKYTYAFEKKTAKQIIEALCSDFNLTVGTISKTSYVIPSIVKENIAAFDIVLDALEETLVNTGKMYVLYDDFGEITVKNVEDMQSTVLICDATAENFDYTSSIDDETYNSIVLYYKEDKKDKDKGETTQTIQIYTASDKTNIEKWGTLRYFEEVKHPSIGQNKADALLSLYNKKTRELKVNGAFGDVGVRGGTLIPVKLYLGDITANNFMLVEKVTHKFSDNQHTMDLTLEGAWE